MKKFFGICGLVFVAIAIILASGMGISNAIPAPATTPTPNTPLYTQGRYTCQAIGNLVAAPDPRLTVNNVELVCQDQLKPFLTKGMWPTTAAIARNIIVQLYSESFADENPDLVGKIAWILDQGRIGLVEAKVINP